jgi:hypothetical protein
MSEMKAHVTVLEHSASIALHLRSKARRWGNDIIGHPLSSIALNVHHMQHCTATRGGLHA